MRKAIGEAEEEDTITFANNIGEITLTGGHLLIDINNLTIDGGEKGVILSSSGAHQILVFANGVDTITLDNLTLQNGRAHLGLTVIPSGGAIYAAGSLTINGSGLSFTGNTANWSGGAIYALEDITLGSDVTLRHNSSGTHGGAIWTRNLWIGDYATFESNWAGYGSNVGLGGAIYAEFDVVLGRNARFVGNQAGRNMVDYNERGDGGAIWTRNLWIDDYATFEFNIAGYNGQERDNVSEGYGGAISIANTLTLGNNVLFRRNVASSDGGAIHAAFGNNVTLSGNTFFTDNVAGQDGGAIFLSGFKSFSADRRMTAILDASTGDIVFSNNKSGAGVYAGSSIAQDGIPNSIHLHGNVTLDLRGNHNLYFDDPISSTTGYTFIDGLGFSVPVTDVAPNHLTKSDGGFVQFLGENTLNPSHWTGTVTISGGEFRLASGKDGTNSSFMTGSGASTFTVESNGRLAGSGIIQGGIVTIEGTIAPDGWLYIAPEWDYTENAFKSETARQEGQKIGMLTLGNDVTFNGATLEIDLGADNASDRIAITGRLTATGNNNIIEIGTWETGVFTLITANNGGINASRFGVDKSGLNSRQDAWLDSTGDALTLSVTSGNNIDLVWSGGTNWNSVGNNWQNNEQFNPNDYVIFGNMGTNQNITVDNDVQVSGMKITGGHYTFSGGTIFGVNAEETMQTVTGKLEVTGGTAVFRNAIDFVNGTAISLGATVEIAEGGSVAGTIANAGTLRFNSDYTLTSDITGNGDTVISLGATVEIAEGGSVAGTIANAGTLRFSSDYTLTNDITGNSNVRKTGTSKLTLDAANMSGKFRQEQGIVELAAGRTWSGYYEQNAGTFIAGNGATVNGNAYFTGAIELAGVLNINGDVGISLTTLKINLGADNVSDKIAVTGMVLHSISRKSTIEIQTWEIGTFTIITATGGIYAIDFDVDKSGLNSRQDAWLNSTGDALTLSVTSGNNLDLVWTGGTNWNTANNNWQNGEMFNPNDYVTFGNMGTNQNITVDNDVQVSGMKITGGHYTFSGGTIVGVNAEETMQTVTGKLEVTGGTAVFRNAVDFVNGTAISYGATVEIAEGGSFTGAIAIATTGTLRFSSDYTLTSDITTGSPYSSNVVKIGTGKLTLDAANMSGAFTQEQGIVELAAGRTWSGSYTQNAGTFIAGNGAAVNGNADFAGTVDPTGVLNIDGYVTFNGTTLKIDLGANNVSDSIAVTELVYPTNSTIKIQTWETGVFTIITARYGLFASDFSVDKSGFEPRQDAVLSGTDSELILTTTSGNNIELVWTGEGDWNTANWSAPGGHVETFLNGDDVFFDNTALNKNVTVADGVSVGSMTVTGTGYTFNLTADSAIVAAGDIHLGNAVLNITDYSPDESGDNYNAARNLQTVVQAGDILSGFNSAVTVSGQASADFLSASAFQSGNEIKVETRLSWYSTDPNKKAHGDFTIHGSETFTLGAALTNHSASQNKEDGWDGNSLTKKGTGTLILTGANTYTGGTAVEAGTLVVNTVSLPGNVDVQNGAELNFAQSSPGTYTGTLSGGGSVAKTGTGALTLSGNSSAFAGTFTLAEGGLHLSNNLGGTFVQEEGTAFTSATGATLGNATFRGTLTPSGTLNAAEIMFEDATVNLGALTAGNKIEATGNIAGGAVVNVDVADVDTSGIYTLMRSSGGEFDGLATVNAANLDSEHRAGEYSTTNALMYEVIAGNTTLFWSGAASDWTMSSGNVNWSSGNFDTYFREGDAVVFDNSAAGKNVTVGAGGVRVDSMNVTSTGYTFNLIAGPPAAIVSTGDINLGDAVLNITGYVPHESGNVIDDGGPWNVQTIVQAGGTLSYAVPNITVAGQAVTSFLTVVGYQVGNEIRVETRLEWDNNGAGGAPVDFGITGGEHFTLGASLSGENSLVKSGGGTLVLTGDNDYSGATTVTEGTLVLEGSLNNSETTLTGGTFIVGSEDGSTAFVGGNVGVESGAVLSGHGTIGGLITIASGGVFAPGSSIGKLNAASGIRFERNSTYLYEIDADRGNFDLLTVSGGTVIIEDGARLDILFHSGSPEEGQRYQVIAITGGTGFNDDTEFTLANTWSTVFESDIRQGDGYYITAISVQEVDNFSEIVGDAASPNALAVSSGLDRIVAAGEKESVLDLYNVLSSMPDNDPQGLADAFAQLHGEVFAASQTAATNMQRRFIRQLPDAAHRLLTPQESAGAAVRGQVPVNVWNRWGAVGGDWSDRKDIGEYSGYTLQTLGVAVGMDSKVTNNMYFGGAFGYDNVNQDFRSIRSQDRIDAFRAVLYAGGRAGNTFTDGYAGYTKSWHNTERDIDISGVYKTRAESKYGDDMLSAGITVGQKMSFGDTRLIPSVGLHYVHLSTPAITETGGGTANLHVQSSQYNSLRLPIGVRWNYTWGHTVVWTPEFRAFFISELGDTSARVHTSFAGARSVSFLSDSGSLGSASGRFGVGLNARLANRVNFRVDYDYETYKDTASNEFGVTLGVNW